jgi:conjugative transfer signal peptidase TraF
MIKKLLLFFIATFCFFMLLKHHVIVNLTSSMPRGIYIEKKKTFLQQGDIIALCLPKQLRQFALQRGYVLRGFYCPQGTTPLIKEIIACPGDHVLLSDNYIQVNHISYRIKKFDADYKRRHLTVYPNGHYQATGYWLLGRNEHSWDSCYFGEIKSKDILCVLRPIFIW